MSDALLAALTSSQEVSCRADLLKAGQVLYTGLPVTGGGVSFSRAQVATRSLSCTLAPELDLGAYRTAATLTGGQMGVDGHEIRVYWTLHFSGGGEESVPLVRARIDSLSGSLAHDSEVSVQGVSREAFVADDSFIAPRTLSGPSAQSLIRQLVTESLSGADVTMRATRDAAVPTTVVEASRWDAVKLLADTISATVRCDAFGRFVVADAPTVDSPAVWQAWDGPAGVLVSAGQTLDRSRVRNCWIVQGSSPSGDSAPMQGVVYDTDPTSPTRYGDPDLGFFGRVPDAKSVGTLTTLAQCQSLAATLLAQTCGVRSSLDLQMVPNPALEVGDVIDVVVSGTPRRHIVDSGQIGLLPGGEFSLATRDLGQAGDA